MEINVDHSIPLWGMITMIGAGIYFIIQMQSRMIIMDKRIDENEKIANRIDEKITILDQDIKQLIKEVAKK